MPRPARMSEAGCPRSGVRLARVGARLLCSGTYAAEARPNSRGRRERTLERSLTVLLQSSEEGADARRVGADVAAADAGDRAHVDARAGAVRAEAEDHVVLEGEPER